jgi:hypothetical protein
MSLFKMQKATFVCVVAPPLILRKYSFSESKGGISCIRRRRL